jgi:glycosyltransferase involved in cell wall biosynthesis
MAQMRILLVAPSAMLTDTLPHGDGLAAFGFLSELARRGHDLHVLAGRVELAAPLPENVLLHATGDAGRIGFMRALRRTYRRLQSEAPFDVVHQLNPVEVGVSLAIPRGGTPVVLGPYVPDWPSWAPGGGGEARGEPLKRPLRAAQQRRAAAALISSPAAEPKLAVRPPQVVELSPGIDDVRLAPGPPRDGQDVLFLGNLEPRKGILVLLDAFAQLAPDLPDARLLIAGDGTLAEAVRAKAAELPRTELLGAVGRERLPETMRSCDVFCAPSFGEPFGITALEAMACARPVVATDAGGLAHLVSEAGGRKVPPGHAPALAGALMELLADAELRRAMGAHNRALVEERYSWTRVVDRLEAVYAGTSSASRSRARA